VGGGYRCFAAPDGRGLLWSRVWSVTDDLDQILLLLVGVFAVFIVMLVVLARTEARLDNPPVQNSWARRRWHRPRVVAGTRARAAAGKETADRVVSGCLAPSCVHHPRDGPRPTGYETTTTAGHGPVTCCFVGGQGRGRTAHLPIFRLG